MSETQTNSKTLEAFGQMIVDGANREVNLRTQLLEALARVATLEAKAAAAETELAALKSKPSEKPTKPQIVA